MIYADQYKPSFPLEFIREKANNTGKELILNDFIALDTETSHNHDNDNPIAWIYQWCFAIGEDIVVGRRPSELIQALNKIKSYAGLTKEKRIVCFVHNLSYDLQYIKDWLIAEYGTEYKMLAIGNHKFITFEIDCFIFKCSYKLSNKSLSKWCADLGTRHKKLDGAIDYDLIHTQSEDEELSEIEWKYQVEDVLTLRECIQKQMQIYGDNLATIPLTSTGYVRRTARIHYKKDVGNRKAFLSRKITPIIYLALKRAFAGGYTHGNRFYAEQTIHGKIRHRDYDSHYPTQQRVKFYPLGKFNLYKTDCTIAEIYTLQEFYCCLIDITFVNIRLKDRRTTNPYISESKAKQGQQTSCHFISDNGRVLKCEGTFTLSLTELDFNIIMQMYEYDGYTINAVYTSVKGKLPQYLLDTVDEFYLGKTLLKKKVKQAEEQYKKTKTEKDFIEYINANTDLMKSKNGLNGIYGMSATDPIREIYNMDANGKWTTKKKTTTEDIEKAINKFYNNYNSFMEFAWGVWTTAHARYELFRAIATIEKAGKESGIETEYEHGAFLYSDTDSIFYLSNDAIENALEKYNEDLHKEAVEMKAYIEINAKKKYYNNFADENENITDFRFLHAKCYCYMESGNMHLTIAGVSPFEDATKKYTREMELGSIDKLEHGFVFTRCGGTKAKYYESKPTTTIYNGHLIEYASGCIIDKTTKTMKNELNTYDDVIDWSVIS